MLKSANGCVGLADVGPVNNAIYQDYSDSKQSLKHNCHRVCSTLKSGSHVNRILEHLQCLLTMLKKVLHGPPLRKCYTLSRVLPCSYEIFSLGYHLLACCKLNYNTYNCSHQNKPSFEMSERQGTTQNITLPMGAEQWERCAYYFFELRTRSTHHSSSEK